MKKTLLIISLVLNVVLIGAVIVLFVKMDDIGIERKVESDLVLEKAEKILKQAKAANAETEELSNTVRREALKLKIAAKKAADGIIDEPLPEPEPSEPKGKSDKYTAEDNASYVAFIEELKDAGLITRIDSEYHNVIVEPALWNGLPYENKQRMASVIGAHFDYTSGYASLSIRDQYSNKKLAAFGIFGFKVYE